MEKRKSNFKKQSFKSNNRRKNFVKREDSFQFRMLKSVDVTPEWISALNYNPLPKLIRKGSPITAFKLIKDVYNLEKHHRLFREGEKRVFLQRALQRLLKTDLTKFVEQLDNEKRSSLAFLELLKISHNVYELGGNKFFPPVKDIIIQLMKFQAEDGRFPLLYHHHSHACFLLLQMGMRGNRLLDKSITWIANRQREDGGWLHRSTVAKGNNYDNEPSCIWTTAEVLQLLSLRQKMFKTHALKASEFLLNRVLQENNSTLMSAQENWDKLGITHTSEGMFTGGTYKVLQGVVNCGYTPEDMRVRKMLNWLIEQQMEDGYFPKIAGHMPIADENVTVNILKLVQEIESTRPKHDNNTDI